MKRGQPQCVLSVDISTCVDTVFYFVGIEGWGNGNLNGQKGTFLDQAPAINPWV